ncbi:MAG: GntR family transcriptional regulator [Firmicutes bacterium]|nr:GntR family transcriptional regulator [Bacillota bacterium]
MYITFDFQSDVPLYLQLRNQVVIAISKGVLKPGDHLPTVRALSDESGVNAMTISKAYQLMKQEGYISTERRGGAVVSAGDKEIKVSKDTVNRLDLCISELRLSGMGEEQIVDLCRRLYREEE